MNAYNYVIYQHPMFHYESFLKSEMDYFVSTDAYAHKDICESVKCFIRLNGIFALFFQLYVRNLTPWKCILNLCC